MKFKNKKVKIGGQIFDSKKEYFTYLKLKALEDGGQIQNLECQKKFVLIPSQYKEEKIRLKNGKEKIKKILLEREVSYYADFTFYKDNIFYVIDVKGIRTKEYIIKRKLMLYIHKIEIIEIE